ncbi:MAG: polyprenyl synthetase family protein [Elusimicrobia bacterium]|nr:polyprenyl synthetase family protein [Elusimicrobiota bacterium]MBP9698626.1 polyprenyl synthetase family protein [Elusimicrobiota bacterium]
MALALRLLEPVLRSGESKPLTDFLAETESALALAAGEKTGFLGRLADYVLTGSGKRVRPALVFLGSQFGKAESSAVAQTALAVEMIHIATLAHDDLVDEAVIRRQRPTVGVKFGEGAAVLLGDYVYAEAFRRLSALGRPDVMSLFAECTMTMCEGEIGQYESRYRFDLSVQDYLSFLQKKTASLMAAACRAGGLLGGIAPDRIRALDTFGDRLGVAFQIVDDILDIEGDEAVVGKTLHTDLIHGKMTLPLIDYAAGLSTDKERAAFQDFLRSPNGRVDAFIADLRRSGVLEKSKEMARSLLREAEGLLATLPDVPARTLLAEVSRRLSDRKV